MLRDMEIKKALARESRRNGAQEGGAVLGGDANEDLRLFTARKKLRA